MATKPTKRILNWASGGTVTDPGAPKESAGWAVGDRPPANWWNWILQSFGDWLSYLEDITDEHETVDIRAFGVVQSGASPSIAFNGAGLSSVAQGGTNSLDVDTSVTFSSEPNICVVVSGEDSQYTFSCSPQDTNTFRFNCVNQSGTAVNLNSTITKFHIIIMGPLA